MPFMVMFMFKFFFAFFFFVSLIATCKLVKTMALLACGLVNRLCGNGVVTPRWMHQSRRKLRLLSSSHHYQIHQNHLNHLNHHKQRSCSRSGYFSTANALILPLLSSSWRTMSMVAAQNHPTHVVASMVGISSKAGRGAVAGTSQQQQQRFKHNIVILGAPGGGKGTICRLLEEEFHLEVVGTGDLIRSEIQEGTNLGKDIAETVKQGNLVSDETVISLLKKKLRTVDEATNIILDGFPRTVTQAEELEKETKLSTVIHVDVPFDVIVKRLSKRYFHPESGRTYHLDFNPPKDEGVDDLTGEPLIRRADDEPETVQNRLETYSSVTQPLLSFYRERGILHTFEGSETNIIFPKIEEYLDSVLHRKEE
eukprot:m.72571 g.72571  ORF g.72571 m.72571 type:complete len:367 (-) comp8388_c1_seq1:57-1157(-)